MTQPVPGDYVELIDVSSIQNTKTINWSKVYASGVRGVWFQTSRYSHDLMADYAAMDAARSSGLAVGGYHFAYCGSDPVAQAEFAVQSVGPHHDGDLPLVLDWEYDKGVQSSDSVRWAETFMSHSGQLTGRTGLLYSYPSFLASHGDLGTLGQYPLFLAAYGPNKTAYAGTPKAPAPWTSVSVHQYIGNGGRVPGIGPDCDRSRCLQEVFDTLTA